MPEPLEGRQQFLLGHAQCVGDHTRGLFEAEASIEVSAAHAPEDGEIFFFFGHSCAVNR
jgi:hypothetical protein